MRRTFGGLFGKKGEAGKDGMSSFQALATAIAAQVGTGNIAGAATAIAVGGPGAIFWMWIAAFLGMATIYCEALMAQKYKQVSKDGTVTGGPVYYIRAAFPNGFGKVLAAIFAVLIVFALGFMGNAVQSNSIAASFHTAFGIPQIATGIVVAVMAVFVFSGGMKRIAKVTETIVPIMAALYIVGALIVIIANIGALPGVIRDIFVGAFNPAAVAGGAMGATIKLAVQKGVGRGLFSNEAGMGSTPHAHAVAKVNHPVEQGFVAMIGVFIDTFIVLNLTAFVILTTGSRATGLTGAEVAKVNHPVEQGFVAMIGVFIDTFIVLNLTAFVILTTGSRATGLTGAELSQYAFSSLFGKAGDIFIAICMFFFAFSTIVGWYFFGEANIRYLFGPKAIKFYRKQLSFIFH